jgi:hypothetical protein
MFPNTDILYSLAFYEMFLFHRESIEFLHGLFCLGVKGPLPIFWKASRTPMKNTPMEFIGCIGLYAVTI